MIVSTCSNGQLSPTTQMCLCGIPRRRSWTNEILKMLKRTDCLSCRRIEWRTWTTSFISSETFLQTLGLPTRSTPKRYSPNQNKSSTHLIQSIIYHNENPRFYLNNRKIVFFLHMKMSTFVISSFSTRKFTFISISIHNGLEGWKCLLNNNWRWCLTEGLIPSKGMVTSFELNSL